jgi:type II secretory pathway component PulM
MTRDSSSRSFGSAFALGAVVALLAAVLWTGLVTPPPAHAQLPDSGAQLAKIIQELQTVNQKLTEIAGLLRESRDKQAGGAKGGDKKP